MSGIEVVGLVLAAIPLIISGLEHYAEGVESIKVIRNATQEFRAVARKLDAENVVFRNTLEILLLECLDVRTQKALLHDVAGAAWTDPEVERALCHRLDSSYQSYIDHIKHVKKTLDQFTLRLEINSIGKGPFDNPKSFRQAFKRLGFALKKSAYLDLIKEIRDDNTHLHILTGQSRTLQIGRRVRRMPNFERIRASAATVFEALQRVLHASCGSPHRASICLLFAPAAHIAIADQSTDGDDEKFRIILNHVGIGPNWIWSMEETEIRSLSLTLTADCHITKSVEVVTIGHNAQSAKPNRSVRFPETLGQAATKVTSEVAEQQPSSVEIQDLCQTIQSLHTKQRGDCLGHVTSPSNQTRHTISKPQMTLMESNLPSCTVHTLDAVIRGKHGGDSRITNADAHRLAVSLATGMLRLHDTPWLEPRWSKVDISIIEKQGRILAQHPFLSRSMQTSPSQAITADTPNGVDNSIIRNPTLFALGVLLVELCMGKSIDKLHTVAELDEKGKAHELSDFKTAARLLDNDEINDRFGKRYSDVVYRCIHCTLDQTKPLLSDKGFRAAVYNNIVRELEDGCQQFLGNRL